MEPLWMKWCRENMPKQVFAEMEDSRQHEARWRDAEIEQLRIEYIDLASLLVKSPRRIRGRAGGQIVGLESIRVTVDIAGYRLGEIENTLREQQVLADE